MKTFPRLQPSLRAIRPILVLVPSLLVAASLSSCGQTEGPTPSESSQTSAVDRATLLEGQKLFQDWACHVCHGEGRGGSRLGPPLANLSAHWNVESLSAYLKDPVSAMKSSEHLQALNSKYPDSDMPEFDYPEEERRALAAWLLAPNH